MSKKKNNKYNSYRRFVIMLVLFVCGFAFAYNGYMQSEFYTPDNSQQEARTDNHQSGTPADTTAKVTDPTGLLNAGQLAILEKYAGLYGQTLATMAARDISRLYSDTASAAYHLNRTALRVLTSIRGMRDIDLTLEYATVEYIVDRVENSGSSLTVYLKENNTQKFKHLSRPSYNANINHVFVLTEKDGGWLIKSHEHEEDFYLLAAEGWRDATGATNALKAESALNIILTDARENLSDLSQFQQGQYLDLKVSDTSYDRDAAVAYAQQWWNTRNYTGNYLAYDDYGGNCQNFASQCLHAGGIDMDYTGVHDVQWKFYDETLNNKSTARGRSYSWTGVDMFYTYAVNNYSDGLVTLTDIDFGYAEKGDVIHVGAYYQWRHALLVTDVLKNADGTLQDIVVASNTADRWNYPLSAYIYTAPRLIHILGQN